MMERDPDRAKNDKDFTGKVQKDSEKEKEMNKSKSKDKKRR